MPLKENQPNITSGVGPECPACLHFPCKCPPGGGSDEDKPQRDDLEKDRAVNNMPLTTTSATQQAEIDGEDSFLSSYGQKMMLRPGAEAKDDEDEAEDEAEEESGLQMRP